MNMKLTTLLCCLLLGLTAVAAGDQPEDKQDRALAETREPACDQFADDGCTREYDPVCGSDGVTYSTECLLCQYNKKNKQLVKVAMQGPCA